MKTKKMEPIFGGLIYARISGADLVCVYNNNPIFKDGDGRLYFLAEDSDSKPKLFPVKLEEEN